MSGVDFTERAEQDLDKILEYIARENPPAGVRFVNEVRGACKKLANQPLMGEAGVELQDGKLRSFSHGNYVIFYRPSDSGVLIIRVLHGARDHRDLL